MFAFLSPQVPIERSFYRIPRFSGLIVGIWPQAKRPCYAYALFAFSALVVGVGGIGENLYGIVYIDNLVGALEAFCPGITKLVCFLKMTIFFAYHRQWLRIVQHLRNMIQSDANDRKNIEELSSTANTLSFLLLASGSVTNMFFNLQPLIMRAYRWWYEQPGELSLPFNLILPKFAENYPMYPFTYILLTASGACTVFTFSFVDGFFLCSCLYICGIFRMVQFDIRRIFANLPDCETFSVADNALIQARLIVIVRRHNAIIDLCTELTLQFRLIVLMHFLSAAFVLCSTILDLMLNSTSISGLIYICYCIAAVTQLFIYCYGGSHVSESSAAVADTLYDIEWYKCDVKSRKMILMILRRAQKAKTIAVPFFTPSLSAFSSILSTAGSYITLFKAFL